MDRPTIDVYEARAEEWRADRTPTQLDAARAFARRVADPGPVLDAGCGPGWYSNDLGAPVVALDAARAMLDLTREAAPGAWPVQADLAHLPFARHALVGAYASKSYVHLARAALPLAWHDLHRSLTVGAPIELVLFPSDGLPSGDELAPFPDDPFAGRSFSGWTRPLLDDVVAGAGFDAVQIVEQRGTHTAHLIVRATRARTLADTVGPGMRLLVCGLNPSLHAADAGIGFVTAGNRFWPAALAAGIISVDRDPVHALVHHGVGMTDFVKRASPRAAELTRDEYAAGLARLDRLAAWLQPGAVCIVGLAGWRAAADRKAVAGVAERTLGGRPVYVMPNPSGINGSSTLADLTDHLRAAAALADRGTGAA
jgi:TDG/mug DNA glycosylase family protein